ncbi:MAG TPA: hypothetical protein ENH62_11220 [Marinobacter sp.]|nr:hypothetical protein [Marinobacter sp.]
MNPMDFETAAGRAIDLWKIDHNEPCMLTLFKENVIAFPLPKIKQHSYAPLLITRFELANGLNNCRWQSIGNTLFADYSKEIACQTHQKH